MVKLKVSEILEATKGILLRGDTSAEISGISKDSRTTAEGDLFIPIIGENFDGHEYIEEAVKSGAAGFLTEKEIALPETGFAIKIDDSVKALHDIAFYYRKKHAVKVVAVTGSVGKTSTKEMIAAVLEQKFRVLKTAGNLNNEVGLPFTILNIEKFHEIAVIEMGMSGFGEISRLSRIASPDIGVITNIGISHIEKLGSRQNILRAKMEILDGMADDGLLVLNGDDALLSGLKSIVGRRTKYYGVDEGHEVQAYDIKAAGEDGISFAVMMKGQEYRVSLPVPGVHNIYNALAAISVGLELGVEPELIIKGLCSFKQEKMRLNILHPGKNIKIINDAYNASPQSVEAAINVLKQIANGHRKIAVLGDMLELGDWSPEAHKDVGNMVHENKIDCLVTFGKDSAFIAQGASEAGFSNDRIFCFDDIDKLNGFLDDFIKNDDIILVKGSRGMRMERIVEHLIDSLGDREKQND